MPEENDTDEVLDLLAAQLGGEGCSRTVSIGEACAAVMARIAGEMAARPAGSKIPAGRLDDTGEVDRAGGQKKGPDAEAPGKCGPAKQGGDGTDRHQAPPGTRMQRVSASGRPP